MTGPSSQPAYITTPIYYVNDLPHIGHVYTTTVCDIYARFMRLAGREVFFLTGTDEHGSKVEKSAKARGITPQQLADENAAEFQRVLRLFQLTNNEFIRTTHPDHERQVQHFMVQLLESGAIYRGTFEGWYDEGQEEYYTETKAKDLKYVSPVTGKALARATEENYYFRLSAYQQTLEDLFAANPEFVRPEARRNEVLGRLREGLQDVPVSRTNFTWGVPMPGDERHVIYVWIDALFNYITALGLGAPEDATYTQRARFWPARYHVIGKEILWFHAVIWPAMLTALKLPLPRCIYAHSHWISEGQKMSKSLGNFIDLETLQGYISAYSLDALRYYLAVQGPLGATDANFSAAHFHDSYNTDLVNTLGNCSSRVTAMISRYFDGMLPPSASKPRAPIPDYDWPALARETCNRSLAATERFELSDAIGAAMALIRKVDSFINLTEPFKVAKDESRRDELANILYSCLEAVRIASLLLWPVMPERMQELWRAIGVSIDPTAGGLEELCAWGGCTPLGRIEKVALFPRVDSPLQSSSAT
jgi:methionyl-tRNA synthetase